MAEDDAAGTVSKVTTTLSTSLTIRDSQPVSVSPQPQGHVFKKINMDGQLSDIVKSMSGVLAQRNKDVCQWGCRAIMNLAKIDGCFFSQLF